MLHSEIFRCLLFLELRWCCDDGYKNLAALKRKRRAGLSRTSCNKENNEELTCKNDFLSSLSSKKKENKNVCLAITLAVKM